MLAAVEDQAHGVVPAAPGRQPVGQQEVAGLDRERELLLDLATRGVPRGLADLDHAAGQVPVALVGELADQDPALPVADQQLADRSLAGEEGVQQRAEGGRLGERGVAGEPRQDDVRRGVGPVAGAGLDAAYSLTAETGPRRHPQRSLVAGLHLRLDARVAEAALARLRERVVGQQPDGPGGQAATPPSLGRAPRTARPRPCSRCRMSTLPASPSRVLDREPDHRPVRRRTSLASRGSPVCMRSGVTPSSGQPNQWAISVVVTGDRLRDVLVTPRPERDLTVGEGRLLRLITHPTTLAAPSHQPFRSQMVASGGTTSVAWAGWLPC